MKKCPRCPRTYEDDSLVFCLEDGARLITVDGLSATLLKSSQPIDPPKTEILPTTSTQSNKGQQTIRAVVPLSYGQNRMTNEPHDKPKSYVWIITGGVIFVLAIGGVLTALGYLAWRGKEKRLEPSTVSIPNIPSQTNPPPNLDSSPQSRVEHSPESKVAVDPADLSWFNGVWTGEGYQTDTQTTWKVVLTIKDGSYAIDYPDIPCRGRWRLIDKNSKGASFTESITQGLDRCTNNGHIRVEKLNDSEISCRFFPAGSRSVNATAVLTKKS